MQNYLVFDTKCIVFNKSNSSVSLTFVCALPTTVTTVVSKSIGDPRAISTPNAAAMAPHQMVPTPITITRTEFEMRGATPPTLTILNDAFAAAV